MYFPYYNRSPKYAYRHATLLGQAITATDKKMRKLVAGWAYLIEKGEAYESAIVDTYLQEVIDRNLVTEPVTGPQISVYAIARNMVTCSERGQDYDDSLTKYLDALGLEPPIEIPAKALYEGDFDYLTTESGEYLTHDMETDDPMLFTDYWTNYKTDLGGNIEVIEPNETRTILTLSASNVPAGLYAFTVSFIAELRDTNDSLLWEVTGNVNSPVQFSIEAKDSAQVDPISYTAQVDWPNVEDLRIDLNMGVTTGGLDVVIRGAGLFFTRVG